MEKVAPKWTPSQELIEGTNLWSAMRKAGFSKYEDFHAWSVSRRDEFWGRVVDRLGIRFHKRFDRVLDGSGGPEKARWLPGARLNIVESCFQAAPDAPAIVAGAEDGRLSIMTYGELAALSDRVARGCASAGLAPGDAAALCMPMTPEAVAAYLGILKAGCAAVGIADSFSAPEIAARLRISKAKAIVTQDRFSRGDKSIPLYERIVESGAPAAVVIPGPGTDRPRLRSGDRYWENFLGDAAPFDAVASDPDGVVTILFSSGTTGEPKAVPWTQTTPLKAAMDGHFHHDLRPGEVAAWPTNLGWMMGPWLIFASLINKGAMALYADAPAGAGFGRFVRDARVAMLGVVPSMVRSWRASGCMEGLDWSAIRRFCSTGECSNAGDYAYLMDLAGNKPVIEYCGGTEIGGGYLTGTLVQPAAPSLFTTPALGLDFAILDEAGRPAELGEAFLAPPSIGLSNGLLNKDHHAVYFEGVPAGPEGRVLRRHGDMIERLPGGFYRAHGRADDTMNLGGIKTSSAEIERVLDRVEGVVETAAVAVPPPGGGPDLLVVYAVAGPGRRIEDLAPEMRAALKSDLNPLFKIHEVIGIASLPRTASNKVMRRELRTRHEKTNSE